MMIILLVMTGCYLLGAVPTAFLMGKLCKNIDIREHGSGNVGFTNAVRVLGAFSGIVTLTVDIGKGFLAVWLAKIYISVPSDNAVLLHVLYALAGIISIVGHNWPVYIGFKGGKGVATGFGVFLALTPVPTLMVIGVWIISVSICKIVSISSIISILLLPIIIYFRGDSIVYIILSSVMALVTVVRHRSNIGRLMRGEENKFNLFKKS